MSAIEQPVTLHRPAARAAGSDAQRWSVEAVQALFDLPFTELLHPRADGASRELRSDRGRVRDAAVDQDRRLPRGLRLLPAGCPLRHRRRGHQADGAGRSAAGRAAREGRRRYPLLHGRRLARTQGPRHRASRRDGREREGAGPGNLRHAGHARSTGRRKRCRRPAWTTTTTTSTPRRSSTATSSPPASTRTASTRWRACATPASRSAAAASSAWANRARSARA